MYEEYDTDDGLSIIELSKVFFGISRKRRIQFAIVCASVAVIVFVILHFAYNYRNTLYTAEFDYEIPSLIDTKSEDGVVTSTNYLDGTPFNINSVVTMNNLNRTKNSNAEFQDIDVEEIFLESEISASKNSDKDYPYTVSINKKYFSSEEQAKKFFTELINYPIVVSESLVKSINNSAYLLQAQRTDISFDDAINNLIYQSDYIISTYDTLIKNSPEVYVYYDGKMVKFNELKNISSSRIDALGLSLLLSQVEDNHYVRNKDNADVQKKLQLKYANLQSEKKKLDSIVANYKDMMSNISVLNEEQFTEFIKAVERKAVVDYQVGVYAGYTGPDATDSPETEVAIEDAIEELTEITNILTAAQKRAYSGSASTVYYSTNKVVSETGNINLIISLVGSLIIGILVSGIVNIVLDLSKYKSMRKDANNNDKKELEPKTE